VSEAEARKHEQVVAIQNRVDTITMVRRRQASFQMERILARAAALLFRVALIFLERSEMGYLRELQRRATGRFGGRHGLSGAFAGEADVAGAVVFLRMLRRSARMSSISNQKYPLTTKLIYTTL